MKKLLSFGLIALALVLTTKTSPVYAQQRQVLELFHGAECPHCHRERACLPQLEKLYPALEIETHEVWHDADNAEKWKQRLAVFGQTPSGVPTNIFSSKVVQTGFDAEAFITTATNTWGAPVWDNIHETKETGFWAWVKRLFSRKSPECFRPFGPDSETLEN